MRDYSKSLRDRTSILFLLKFKYHLPEIIYDSHYTKTKCFIPDKSIFNELKNNLLSATQDFHATHWLEIKAFKDNKTTLNVSAVKR